MTSLESLAEIDSYASWRSAKQRKDQKLLGKLKDGPAVVIEDKTSMS